MKQKWIIIGLRAIHPTILGDVLPGYLGEATENHRYGFQLPGGRGVWYAWYTDPWKAKQFDHPIDTDVIVAKLVINDPGWWRPITVISIYI